MIVIRIDSSGDMVNSRPCHNCLDMMKAVGVRKIFYSHNNNIICERVNNMISINSSSIMRKLERDYYNAPIDDNTYYKYLLIRKSPKNISKYNVECFLNYNFNEILPTFNYDINSKRIQFYDSNGKFFLKIDIY